MDEKRILFLQERAKDLRVLILDMLSNLGVGHVGGCLSIADVLCVLYFEAMNIRPEQPQWPQRDRLVLSKGHAGPALYAALALRGYFPIEQLKTLNRIGTRLPSHCDRKLTAGVDMTAGSLGQGFSCAVGIAIGQKLCGYEKAYTYAIIGDGESQEGQIWEAAMLAGNRSLENLIAFTDYNKLQIDGSVAEVNNIAPLADKWRAFGFSVREIDGHDIAGICEAVQWAKTQAGSPKMIILHTVKGKGASFCEGKLASHNMPVSREEYEQALLEIRGGK